MAHTNDLLHRPNSHQGANLLSSQVQPLSQFPISRYNDNDSCPASSISLSLKRAKILIKMISRSKAIRKGTLLHHNFFHTKNYNSIFYLYTKDKIANKHLSVSDDALPNHFNQILGLIAIFAFDRMVGHRAI